MPARRLPTPAEICRGLLAALEASEGRRQRRQRDTRPDALGLAIKRELLERIVAEAPTAEALGGWLLGQSLVPRPDVSTGAVRAMAMEILMDYRLALTSDAFRAWLDAGCPSDDRAGDRAADRVPSNPIED
ncbi:MAG TPA: hypothetical protein VJU81_18255 [Methylomirabilota bacterium]|nr:hypothetical protein [Methylomirabilota bacterium]